MNNNTIYTYINKYIHKSQTLSNNKHQLEVNIIQSI